MPSSAELGQNKNASNTPAISGKYRAILFHYKPPKVLLNLSEKYCSFPTTRNIRKPPYLQVFHSGTPLQLSETTDKGKLHPLSDDKGSISPHLQQAFWAPQKLLQSLEQKRLGTKKKVTSIFFHKTVSNIFKCFIKNREAPCWGARTQSADKRIFTCDSLIYLPCPPIISPFSSLCLLTEIPYTFVLWWLFVAQNWYKNWHYNLQLNWILAKVRWGDRNMRSCIRLCFQRKNIDTSKITATVYGTVTFYRMSIIC